jgi:transposase
VRKKAEDMRNFSSTTIDNISVEDQASRILHEGRIAHDRGEVRDALRPFSPGSPVAVETTANWYWIVDEVEAAGMEPRLVNARRAKWMLSSGNKTDKLDARGLNRLQRSGTLPTVWIPPGELRDQRDLPRTRMVLSRQRIRLKNRIHATLAKYAIRVEEASDIFGARGQKLLEARLPLLPPHSRYATEELLAQLEQVVAGIGRFEQRMREVFTPSRSCSCSRPCPGSGSSWRW